MSLRRQITILLAGISLALAAIPALPARAQTVQVVLDGQAVLFDQPPIIIGGRVLVPLRGVFERLGAFVQWNPATNTVTAMRGDTQVQLAIGSPQAVVNGRAVALDVPPMIVGGRTLVPLRFVSETLGARVDWNYASSTVFIFSPPMAQPVPPPAPPAPPAAQPVPPSPAPAPPPNITPTVVEGTLVRVDSQTSPPRILVQREDLIYTFFITSDTTLTRTDAGTGRRTAIVLNQIQPGNLVRVTADTSNRAIVVNLTVREISGRLDAVTPRMVALSDGQTFTFADGVQVFINGREVTKDQLQAGMQVTLRLNPQTSQVVTVAARNVQVQPPPPPPASPLQITSFTHNVQRPLRAGETLTVSLRGTPGATATFDIFGVASGIAMSEVASGAYQGTYTVRSQDNVVDAVILGHLRIAGRQAPVVQAGTPVTMDTQPPRILQRFPDRGQVVNNTRPNIVITFDDPGGSGIDAGASRLMVNGQNVTSRLTFTETSLAYALPVPMAGQVVVRVVLADRAGNIAQDQFQFMVTPVEGSLIRAVTVNPTTLRLGDMLTVTATGAAGGQASFRVEGVSGDIPMTESPNQPGVYVGSLAIQPRNRVMRDVRVTVSLTLGTITSQAEASARLTIVATDRVAPPVITSPVPGTRLGNVIQVRGTATPGFRVVVRVDYHGSLLVVNLRGTYGEVSTTADAAGNWAVTINQTTSLTGAELTITAVVIDPFGRRSEPAVLSAIAG